MADLTNKIFGIYKVIEKDTQLSEEKKRVYWKCICLKCGNEISVRSDGLKRLPKTCPECKYLNLVGQKFGKLLVIEKAETDKNGHRYFVCQCECGNIVKVSGSNLIEKKTNSCGCLHKQIISNLFTKDLTGQVFGKLTVIKRAENKNNRVLWLCQCDCGNTIAIQSNNLLNGHTKSCGCVHSTGELLIRNILNNYNIQYITEYTFSDLPKRRFDFAIFKNKKLAYLIEFDGKQHFSYISTWHKTKEEFLKAKQRDEEKNKYCKENNIKLYRISYLDNIEEKLEEIFNLEEVENA